MSGHQQTADKLLAGLALYEAAERKDQTGWDALVADPDACTGLLLLIHTLLNSYSTATGVPVPMIVNVLRGMWQAVAVTE